MGLDLGEDALGLRLVVEAWHGAGINFEIGEFGALISAVSKCPNLQVMPPVLQGEVAGGKCMYWFHFGVFKHIWLNKTGNLAK